MSTTQSQPKLYKVIYEISPDESKEHFLSNKNENLAIYLVENDNEYQYAGIFIKDDDIISQDNSRSSIERLKFEDTTNNTNFFIHHAHTFYIVEQTNANDLETGDFIYIDEIDRQPPRQALYRIIENNKKRKYVTVSSANIDNRNAKIYKISTITWKKFRIVTDNYNYYVNKVKAGRIPNRQRKTRRVKNKKRKTLKKNNIKRKRSNPTRKY
jgi:hypothetical protein